MSGRKFTPEQIASIRKRFAELDVTRSGLIDRQTMAEILSIDGEDQFDRLVVVLLFEKYDKNHDGKISFDEFIDFCEATDDLTEVAILSEIFQIADSDKSGLLDVDEVYRIGKLMGLDISKADAWATIAALDKDGNNQVDFTEFCAILGESR